MTEKIEQNSDSNLVISDDGKILYYVDDIPEEESAGELYEIEIVDGKLQKAVLYDSDVYTEMRIPAYVWNEKYTYTILEDDEHLIYVKDYQEDSDCGDLYINKIRLIMMYVYLIHFMIKKVERSYIVPIGMLKMNVEH